MASSKRTGHTGTSTVAITQPNLMYYRNVLKDAGQINLANVPIDLRKIDIPVYFLSTREDHIAPWRSTYAGTKLMSGPVHFVLGASGHGFREAFA